MSDGTSIEWSDATWNPVRGCTKVSAGCKNCYAERFAERFRGVPGHPFEHGFDVRLVPEALGLPLRWRRPRRVFVNSMSDLFHPDVPDEFIDRVFAVMAAAHWHTFQVLTKRPERMREYLSRTTGPGNVLTRVLGIARQLPLPRWYVHPQGLGWPYQNIWLGTSVEDQRAADERIPHLLATPAALRFLSCEPLLGPVDLRRWTPHAADREMVAETTPSGKALSRCRVCGNLSPGHEAECRTLGMVGANGLHWVIVGGESGPGARPCDLAWIRSLLEQCEAAGIAPFVKQLGARPVFEGERVTVVSHRKGADPAEWPEDLRVREAP